MSLKSTIRSTARLAVLSADATAVTFSPVASCSYAPVVPPIICKGLPSRSQGWAPRRHLHAVPTVRAAAKGAQHDNTDAERGPMATYDARVAAGLLRDDEHQRSIIATYLEPLWKRLQTYRPTPIPKRSLAERAPKTHGLWSRIFGGSTSMRLPGPEPGLPPSLYLHGDVGCGKSMLMDLLFACIPAHLSHDKRRIHFHAFMIDVHKRLHALGEAVGHKAGDLVVPVARELAREGRIFCFDEFQVTDIVDAMILRRLIETMNAYGVVSVMTSNRQPRDLYKNGIQRQSFMPCIHLIEEKFDIVDLDSNTDYRKIPRALSKVYFDPISHEHEREIEKLFEGLTEDEPVVRRRQLDVWGRKLYVPESTNRVAKFTFADLFAHALSSADYLEITKKFETIFVVDIPKLTFNQRDQARRFILFIDSAYESKTKLFCLSEVPITEIFSDRKDTHDEISDAMRAAMDDLGLNADQIGASSIFSGEEEIFAFARAVSRLSEMGSAAWSGQDGRHAEIALGASDMPTT
ncbi:uncharacterized protein L969DRAFT_113509 [Mixia osmundae IAM 14324]|uniref:AAA+ ATPase domain-containing protein n=1 Tax=Mixia osmundae (strain CBS 9802 / IAM 14324 / JCM 22182 / KY 12970) TaxID=764103 RepID=G7E4L5_MIXOS|nr:uncharacterized protein L969DRAFT_113509 [Mixia osmundae IAM 14324]KEI41845.1 hypothetical protein L969DRAFT_113509 [Mixia osmundae IAM 14324]GAA97775.1 hypothetical protein E5Q_04454 [Mixia osmundae IAM 14324]